MLSHGATKISKKIVRRKWSSQNVLDESRQWVSRLNLMGLRRLQQNFFVNSDSKTQGHAKINYILTIPI